MPDRMVLDGLKAIAAFLGMSSKRARRLIREGAPIRVLGSGRGRRYLSEACALAAWASGSSSGHQ